MCFEGVWLVGRTHYQSTTSASFSFCSVHTSRSGQTRLGREQGTSWVQAARQLGTRWASSRQRLQMNPRRPTTQASFQSGDPTIRTRPVAFKSESQRMAGRAARAPSPIAWAGVGRAGWPSELRVAGGEFLCTKPTSASKVLQYTNAATGVDWATAASGKLATTERRASAGLDFVVCPAARRHRPIGNEHVIRSACMPTAADALCASVAVSGSWWSRPRCRSVCGWAACLDAFLFGAWTQPAVRTDRQGAELTSGRCHLFMFVTMRAGALWLADNTAG